MKQFSPSPINNATYSSNMNEEALIAAVAVREFLYNKNDPRHSNRGLIRKAWEDVAESLQLDVETVKRKWVNLRDYFLRLIRADVRAGQVNPKRRKWLYYEPMSFLLPFITGKDGNFPACWEEGYEEEIEQKSQESLYELPGPSTDSGSSGLSFEKRKLPKLRSFEPLIDSVAPDPFPKVDEEENLLFFRSLLPQMKLLDELETLEFRHEVQSLLIKTLRNKKRRSSQYPTDVNKMAARLADYPTHLLEDDSMPTEPISFVTKSDAKRRDLARQSLQCPDDECVQNEPAISFITKTEVSFDSETSDGHTKQC